MDADELKDVLAGIRQIQADLDAVIERLGPPGTGDDQTRWMRTELRTIGNNSLSMLARKIATYAGGKVDTPPI